MDTARSRTTTVVASQVGNASRAKNAAEMASELSNQIGKNSVSYRTPNKVGHIDLQGKPHFDKATGTRISTPHVQERTIHRSPNGRTNVGRQTTRPATKQDVRTARKLVKRRGNNERD